MPTSYDAIIIGSGQAGPFLAVRLAQAGKRVVLFESQHVGGTCLNDGCTPTKTLVASARAAHVVRHAARFGVELGSKAEVSIDMKKVKARKDQIVQHSVASLTDWLEATEHLTLVRAKARFTGTHEVEANGVRYAAPLVYVNVGGSPTIPDIAGLKDVSFLTNTTMMDLDVVPDHLVIIGGSYIALEFAQMYRRFAARVTVLEHGRQLVGREDADVAACVLEILTGEGIDVRLGADQLRIEGDGAGARIHYRQDDVVNSVRASHLLVATGRTPNTADLGLDAAGIETDSHGYIKVDDQLQSNVAGVYALGDVNGRGAFTHTSYNDFEIVSQNLLDGRSRSLRERVLGYALYIDPPLGRAGLTEKEVRQLGKPALMATLPMKRVGRARERGEELGFMKVLVDPVSRQILGASLLGIEADEVVQQLLLAMSAKLPYTVITDTMGIHPTVSELLPSLFAGLKPLDMSV